MSRDRQSARLSCPSLPQGWVQPRYIALWTTNYIFTCMPLIFSQKSSGHQKNSTTVFYTRANKQTTHTTYARRRSSSRWFTGFCERISLISAIPERSLTCWETTKQRQTNLRCHLAMLRSATIPAAAKIYLNFVMLLWWSSYRQEIKLCSLLNNNYSIAVLRKSRLLKFCILAVCEKPASLKFWSGSYNWTDNVEEQSKRNAINSGKIPELSFVFWPYESAPSSSASWFWGNYTENTCFGDSSKKLRYRPLPTNSLR